jgi:hypothetical protein
VGQGATLRSNGSGNAIGDSVFLIENGSSYITIRGFNIEGNNTKTGSALYGGGESQMGVAIYGASHLEISGNTISKTWGDGVYAGSNGSSHAWTDTLWVHDNTFRNIGRMAFTMNAARNWTIEGNNVDQVGMYILDIEPDYTYEGATNGMLRNNTVGAYGLTSTYSNWFAASAYNSYAAGALIDRITITGNLVTTGMPVHTNNPNGGGLNIQFSRVRTSNITVTNNTSQASFGGGSNLSETPMYFMHVDGLRVSGNVQPTGQSRPLATISDSTSVTYQP